MSLNWLSCVGKVRVIMYVYRGCSINRKVHKVKQYFYLKDKKIKR